mgnify:FL=1
MWVAKMKSKLLFSVMCMLPFAANAAIPYRVQQVVVPETTISGNNDQAFASRHRFYVGGMYDFSMWGNYTSDEMVHVSGKNTSSFEVVAGVRPMDTFRVEANYIRTDAQWNAFKLTGNTAMVNAIFDARIDSMYRLFHTQRIVPYVGAGAGLSWNSGDDVRLDKKISGVFAALAGVGFELGEYFTVDLGYRYMYMLKPEFDTVPDFAPTAHQFRAGVRLNF